MIAGFQRAQPFEILHRHDGAELSTVTRQDDAFAPLRDVTEHVGDPFADGRDGVAEVRVVLAGFAATDLATRGTVTFDAVGLFAE